MPATRRALLAAIPALLAAPRLRAAALPDLTIWGPPAGPSVTAIAAIQQGYLEGVAMRLAFRAWRDPDELRAGIASGTMAAAIMPTVAAANLHNRGLGLRLLNVMTDGLLFLVAPEPVANLASLRGKALAVPFRNDTPEFLLRRMLAAEGIGAGEIRLHTAGTPGEAAQLLIAGRLDAALLPEPAASAAILGGVRGGRRLVRALDLQEAFGRLSGQPTIPQAGMSVRDGLAREALASLARGLAHAAAWVRANPATAAGLAAQPLGMPAPVIEASIPHSRLVAHAARDARPALEGYFRTVAEADAAMLGGRLPGEGFYL